MEVKHAKGPWGVMQWDKTLGVTGPAAAAAMCAAGGVRDSVVCKNHPLLEVASGNGVYGGTSVALVFGNDQQTCEANTRLIAAAPELLEALRIAVRQNSHDMLMTGEELRQCEAAIAKATGEQQ